KTALMTASQLGNVDAVKWLLAHGANVEARTIAGDEWVYPRHGRRTAIHYGAASGDIDVVKVLIAAGAKVDVLDDVGFSVQDYLVGRDDLPGNASISDKDRAALLNLITPQ
ncbi:MAG: ankyrin repeat domain-containing protein, partial [Thalassospira sp.]|uniref:ankyrin repeat domain-containing protein n=1 Tax=Thalassospira sp. TaxID=1912094 RepID=UPI0032EF5A79